MKSILLVVIWLLATGVVFAQPLFAQAVDCIKRHEGFHGAGHYPYVGYGHRLLPGERYRPNMSERSADLLLRADLKHRCALFRRFGKDSLLLAVLAYNVGETRVWRSRLVAKLRKGHRDIYGDYISFRLINGRVSAALEQRRKEEFNLLFHN